jgi:hypothetical protein
MSAIGDGQAGRGYRGDDGNQPGEQPAMAAPIGSARPFGSP